MSSEEVSNASDLQDDLGSEIDDLFGDGASEAGSEEYAGFILQPLTLTLSDQSDALTMKI